MKLGIMQPYIFPYIGYFQLINAVDKFVVYDNIQFTKKGWINRNRILVNGKDEYFTIPLKKDSDYLNVDERRLADSFPDDKLKLLRKLSASYSKVPHFASVFPMIESIFHTAEENLFRFIYQTLQAVCKFLEIETEFVISSTLPIEHSLRSQEKVIAICKAMHADLYINPIGGVALYAADVFELNKIDLRFIKPGPIEYQQFKNEFVPWLSIIDVMMFNSKEEIKEMLNSYTLI